MTKTSGLMKILEGAHVLGDDGLRDYHVAQRVKNANRKRKDLLGSRFLAVRQELKNYRVMVSLTDDDVRIYRPDTRQEYFLSRGLVAVRKEVA